jgi:hypothetical protein
MIRLLALAVMAAALPTAVAATDLRPRAKPVALMLASGATPPAAEAPPLAALSSHDPGPQPGDWSVALDPELDLDVTDPDRRRAEQQALTDLLLPLRVDRVTLRVTRHF